MKPWAVDPDDGPDFIISRVSPAIERIASMSFKQPQELVIRVAGSVDYFFPPLCMAKKPITSSAMEGTAEKRMPVKVLRKDDVSASIFQRDIQVRGETRTFYSVSISRSYRDSAGAWKYAKYFDVEDLGKIVLLCEQADEFIQSELRKTAA